MADRTERKQAEHEYCISAFDYASAPVGSRDWTLFWSGWQKRAAWQATPPADAALEDAPAWLIAAESTFHAGITYQKNSTIHHLQTACAEYRKAAAALRARAVPDGFVMVPIEPTKRMRKAGREANGTNMKYQGHECDAIYRAMLAASKEGV